MFVVGLTVVLVGSPTGVRDDLGAPLRVACGLAHVRQGREDALDVLAGLLHDPYAMVRAGAARGLGAAGRRDASALLRYKLVAGDPQPEVIEEVVAGLMALQRERAIPLCIDLLHGDDPTRAEVIALALGSQRATEALDALVAWSSQLRAQDRARIGFLPIALLRDDAANAWLIERITGKFAPDARGAARALMTFQADPAVAAQLAEAARAQPDRALRAELLALLS